MMWKAVFLVLAALSAVELVTLIGGLSDIALTDEGAQNALKFAVVEHNREINDLYRNDVVEVVRVQRQLVSGYKYKITVKMGKTSCRKESTATACPPHQDPTMAQSRLCVFEVWSKPWNTFYKLLSHECK